MIAALFRVEIVPRGTFLDWGGTMKTVARLGLVLAVAMLASPAVANAQGQNEATNAASCTVPAIAEVKWEWTTNADNTISITKYTGSGGEVAIPDSMDGKSVTKIADYAFGECTTVTALAISDTVTNIGVGTFSHCTELRKVTIPNSTVSIGGGAFRGCPRLTTVTIPPGVVSIGQEAFLHCMCLYGIKMTDSVTNIGDVAFGFCGLTDIDIPRNVTYIADNLFFYCHRLTNVTIHENVQGIGREAFAGCGSLASMAVPNGVTTIHDKAFTFCHGLASVVIGSDVTNIADAAFSWCLKLTGIYFNGDAPVLGNDVFNFTTNVTIYYLEGSTGWGSTFGGRPTAVWKTQGETNGTVVSTNKDMTVDLGGGVKMEMVWIPPGEFLMGSPTNEPGRFDNETQHKVTLTKGFWMGKHEVTQEQWEKVTGKNPSNVKGAKNPVERVSWNDTQDFIKKLNETIRGGGFRLPTETEWEYACRAGTKTKFYSGDNDTDLAEAGWYSVNSGGKTHPVGGKKANAFGLYDMHGNVWEWCQDWYGDYATNTMTDPTGPSSGSLRVLRGGSWGDYPAYCRSALRSYGDPTSTSSDCGFRVVYVR